MTRIHVSLRPLRLSTACLAILLLTAGCAARVQSASEADPTAQRPLVVRQTVPPPESIEHAFAHIDPPQGGGIVTQEPVAEPTPSTSEQAVSGDLSAAEVQGQGTGQGDSDSSASDAGEAISEPGDESVPQDPGQQGPFANCAAAHAAGVTPLHRGDPGYDEKLDRDGDGVACER